ncbi:MAG: permease, partial [Pseudomonadota bacterium]
MKFKRQEFIVIFRMLVLRSGLAFLLSGVFVLLAPGLTTVGILVATIFPQSAISFWPFAHLS